MRGWLDQICSLWKNVGLWTSQSTTRHKHQTRRQTHQQSLAKTHYCFLQHLHPTPILTMVKRHKCFGLSHGAPSLVLTHKSVAEILPHFLLTVIGLWHKIYFSQANTSVVIGKNMFVLIVVPPQRSNYAYTFAIPQEGVPSLFCWIGRTLSFINVEAARGQDAQRGFLSEVY